jgi:hypothetical protein
MTTGLFSKSFWWFLFLLDTVVLSWCFQEFKHFTLYPNLIVGAQFLGVIALFVLCTLTLVYDSYVRESQLGKVKHPVRLFEWLKAKQFATVKSPVSIQDHPRQ